MVPGLVFEGRPEQLPTTHDEQLSWKEIEPSRYRLVEKATSDAVMETVRNENAKECGRPLDEDFGERRTTVFREDMVPRLFSSMANTAVAKMEKFEA